MMRRGVVSGLPRRSWRCGRPARRRRRRQNPPKTGKTTWDFYTVAWGHQDEFLDLFARNHYPLLKALEVAGHYTRVRTYVPITTATAARTGRLPSSSSSRPSAAVDRGRTVKSSSPTRKIYKHEEQRRFEILVAHWDVPLNVVDLGKP